MTALPSQAEGSRLLSVGAACGFREGELPEVAGTSLDLYLGLSATFVENV